MAEEDEDPIARFEELLDARLSRKPKPKAKPPGVASSRRRGGDSSDDDDDEEAATDPGGVIRLTVQPPCVKGGVMRDYQLEGLNWMSGFPSASPARTSSFTHEHRQVHQHVQRTHAPSRRATRAGARPPRNMCRVAW